jgi:SPX domain protein involved in polyphosphate accumulation
VQQQFFKVLGNNLNKVEMFYTARLAEFAGTLNSVEQQAAFLMKEVSTHDQELAEHAAEEWRKKMGGSEQSMPRTASHTNNKFSIKGVKLGTARRALKYGLGELETGLRMLRDFGVLNNTGFVTIMEKFDKANDVTFQAKYLEAMENAKISFHQYETVDQMRKNVQEIYSKLFTDGDHDKAFRFLKRSHNHAEHLARHDGFFFAGALLATVTILGVLCCDKSLSVSSSPMYLNTWPIYRLACWVLIHTIGEQIATNVCDVWCMLRGSCVLSRDV